MWSWLILSLCLSLATALTFDPAKDYYAILDMVESQTPPTPQQVLEAFHRKLRQFRPDLWSKDSGIPMPPTDELKEARSVLSDPATRNAWLRARRSPFAQNSGAGPFFSNAFTNDMTFNVNLMSAIAQAMAQMQMNFFANFMGGRLGPVGFAFNQGHHRRTVEYYRENPGDGFAARDFERHQEAYHRPERYPINPLYRLEDRWLDLDVSSAGALEAVRDELSRIRALAKDSEITLSKVPEVSPFFHWWFSQPMSVMYPELLYETYDELPPKGDMSRAFLRAVMAYSHWRTRKVAEIALKSPHLDSLGEYFASEELSSEVDLSERYLAAPAGQKMRHQFLSPALATSAGLSHPQWYEAWLDSPTSASLFLGDAVWYKEWRFYHPHLFTRALELVSAKGSREHHAVALLSAPDAILHPEWLEIIIKTDRYEFMTDRLNGVLALDHWYLNPYLRHILGGRSLTVANLREVEWPALSDLPLKSLETSSAPRCVDLFLRVY